MPPYGLPKTAKYGTAEQQYFLFQPTYDNLIFLLLLIIILILLPVDEITR